MGHASDDAAKTGVTVVVADVPNVASVHVVGGAPGTRETDLLAPENTVESIDALVLSGGSAFGLAACDGVLGVLAEQGRGFEVGAVRVPIVPGAILFDLANGGTKTWTAPPYAALGAEAATNARAAFTIGSVGAGTGATTGGGSGEPFGLKGGLGTASAVLSTGATVSALVAVNALGTPICEEPRNVLASPFELNGEFGTFGGPVGRLPDLPIKFAARPSLHQSTTIAVVATDAKLSKAGAKRLAVSAHDGFARALWPAHTPLDGDLVFSVATGTGCAIGNPSDALEISAAASSVMARAIARGVLAARSAPGDLFPPIVGS